MLRINLCKHMKVKHALKILFSFIIFKIRSGPLKGKKWIMTTGSKFILGTQELYKTEAFLKYFRKGDVLFNIGAHVGYFSAIGAVFAGGWFVFRRKKRSIKVSPKNRHWKQSKTILIVKSLNWLLNQSAFCLKTGKHKCAQC